VQAVEKGGSGCGRQGRVLRFWSGIHVSEADSAHLTGHPDLAMNGQLGDGGQHDVELSTLTPLMQAWTRSGRALV